MFLWKRDWPVERALKGPPETQPAEREGSHHRRRPQICPVTPLKLRYFNVFYK